MLNCRLKWKSHTLSRGDPITMMPESAHICCPIGTHIQKRPHLFFVQVIAPCCCCIHCLFLMLPIPRWEGTYGQCSTWPTSKPHHHREPLSFTKTEAKTESIWLTHTPSLCIYCTILYCIQYYTVLYCTIHTHMFLGIRGSIRGWPHEGKDKRSTA